MLTTGLGGDTGCAECCARRWERKDIGGAADAAEATKGRVCLCEVEDGGVMVDGQLASDNSSKSL